MRPQRADGGPSRQTLIPFPAAPDTLSGSQSPRISRPLSLRAARPSCCTCAHAVTKAPSWGSLGAASSSSDFLGGL